jgi:hypothetical protein
MIGLSSNMTKLNASGERLGHRAPAVPFGWWLSLAAAIASAACFVVGLRMVGSAVAPALVTAAAISKAPAKGEEGAGDKKAQGVSGESLASPPDAAAPQSPHQPPSTETEPKPGSR